MLNDNTNKMPNENEIDIMFSEAKNKAHTSIINLFTDNLTIPEGVSLTTYITEYNTPTITFKQTDGKFLRFDIFADTDDLNSSNKKLKELRLSVYSFNGVSMEEFKFFSFVGKVSEFLSNEEQFNKLSAIFEELFAKLNKLFDLSFIVMSNRKKLIETTKSELLNKANNEELKIPQNLKDRKFNFNFHPKIDKTSFIVLSNTNIESIQLTGKKTATVVVDGLKKDIILKSDEKDFLFTKISECIVYYN